jgi:2Fe-2S ferredoxin
MVALTIISRSGAKRQIDAESGSTLMETIREAGFDELQAVCGGQCSCGTCHVYLRGVDQESIGLSSPCETELLNGLAACQVNSRLACQVLVTSVLAGSDIILV